MVVGKLLILMVCNSALASEVTNPRFFEYRSGGFVNRLVDVSFGWFKTLNDEQQVAYHQASTQAVMYADNGQTVRWYKGTASGEVTPVMTRPSSDGYCRHMHIRTWAYNTEKTLSALACYSDVNDRWQWVLR
jgi:surface antigen